MTRYYIEKECLKCDACNHTGWRSLSKPVENRKKAKDLLKYYRHFFKNDVKVRMRKN